MMTEDTSMIKIISTGGTIAESPGEGDRIHLSSRQLVAGLGPAFPSLQVETMDLMDVPSTFMRPQDMLRIAAEIDIALADPRVSGAVVTHGTATMEETAFCLDVTRSPGKPVVLTGALLTPGEVGYDGLMNLADAIATAASPASHGLGALVVMNGEIHAARDVVKAHASALGSFRSPEFGPLGRVDRGNVYYARQPSVRTVPLSPNGPPATVPLLTCYAGMEGDELEILAAHAKGLVLQGMGSGTAPPWLVNTLAKLVNAGTAVVLTSRCAEGRVSTAIPERRAFAGYPETLYAVGVIPSWLPGLKARLKLSLALVSGLSEVELKERMLQ
jgi:L-asparaginase